MPSSLTFTPADNLITPLITELAAIAQNQVGGITTVYMTPPPGPPDHGSIAFMLMRGKNNTSTIGRLRQDITFVLMQFFRFNDLADAYTQAYSYIYAYTNAFEDWQNQRLNNKAVHVNVTDYGVAQRPYAGQPYLVLGITLEVCAEMPTPTL